MNIDIADIKIREEIEDESYYGLKADRDVEFRVFGYTLDTLKEIIDYARRTGYNTINR